MSKSLQMILTLLRKQPVPITSIVSLLQTDNTVSLLGLNNLLSDLVSYKEEFLSSDLVEYLQKIVEVTINEQKEITENKINSLIVNNSFNHYNEIVTCAPENIGDDTIITDYKKDSIDSNAQFYAFYPKTPKSKFMVGELTFEISPVSEINITDKTGVKKNISYKFKVKITCARDPIAVKQKFTNFKIDTLYQIIGMSYLAPKNVTVTQSSDLITLLLDTYPFHAKLANTYNLYYSNLKNQDGIRLTEISGIESCHFDSNGVILVPQLFYLSSIYTDGDIGTRPFIWEKNMGIEPVVLEQQKYAITLECSRGMKDEDIDIALASLRSHMMDHDIKLNIVDTRTENRKKAYIEGYDSFSEDNHQFQSGISSKLNLESKVSYAFRMLCQEGSIGPNDYSTRNNSNSQGNERYTFAYDKNLRTIKSLSSFNENKITIYYNRSAFISNNDDNMSSKLVGKVKDRNSLKYQNTATMIAALSSGEEYIEYNGNRWPNVYSNYIPTSFMPIIFSERGGPLSKKSIGISFIPFGFARYVSTDLNVAGYDSGFAVYGSDFELSPVPIRRVIKLSSNMDEISNIHQIIVESDKSPDFVGPQPLKTIRIDDTHFICLFKSVDKFQPATEVTWYYASSYMQNMNISTLSGESTSNLIFTFEGGETIKLSEASLTRYFIETLTVGSSFNTMLFDNMDLIFANGPTITLAEFCTKIVDDVIIYNALPKEFFKLLGSAASCGTINDNVLDWIVNLADSETSNSGLTILNGPVGMDIVSSIRNFIRSIKVPVPSFEYPYYSSAFQTEITNKFNEEIEVITNKIYRVSDSLVDKTPAEIKSIATQYDGLLKTVINQIADQVGDDASKTKIIEIKNESIIYLRGLIKDPILSDYLGRQIKPSMIEKFAELVDVDIFNSLIKIVYSSLVASSYEQIILDLCREATSIDENFVVTMISPYRYNVTFNSAVDETVLAMNGAYVESLDMTLSVSNVVNTINEFGEFKFDSSVHCMFEVNYNSSESIDAVILNLLKSKSIYYTQIGDEQLLTNLSIVSLYGMPEKLSDEMFTVKFFLPFMNDGGRLTIKSSNIKTDFYEMKLLNKTVEVVLIANNINEDIAKRFVYTELVNIDVNNLESIRSICLGMNAVKKPYNISDRSSHYIFTDDLKNIATGTYTQGSAFNDEKLWKEIDSLKIVIHPVSSFVCKFYYKFNQDNVKNIKTVGKELRLSHDKVKSVFSNFNTNFIEILSSEFDSPSKQKDEILVINGKNGIFTKSFGDRKVETKLATTSTTYNHILSKVNMSNIDQLTNIEEQLIKDKVDDENEKLRIENTRHNLALSLSTIKWNSKQVENYRFFSDEKPKWVKFSNDAYFMAIGFQSGIKLHIKTGDRYTFCTNLYHESVSDIIFGNKMLCITLQYEDSTRPFGNLWVAAAGVRIPIDIDYYNLSDGDAANIKYITGDTLKDKKNAIVTVDEKGITYLTKTVQSAKPIFDNNVYFFSPNDRYLILNKNGTFAVHDLETFTPVKFTSYNGTDNTSAIQIKTIESGVWTNNHTFVGFTYSALNPLNKQKITINIENKSLVQVQLISEYPTSTLSENMLVNSSIEIHPLYSYLMNYRNSQNDLNFNNEVGTWIYDLYISTNRGNLIFTTVDGFHSAHKLDLSMEIEELISLLEFGTITDISGIHILNVKLGDTVLFNRQTDEKSEAVSLQYISGNYFMFHGDSVYIWKYFTKPEKIYTELTHINSNGYEKMTFEDHVAFIITDKVRVCVFTENNSGFLAINSLNLSSEVAFTSDVDVSKVTKKIHDEFGTNILMYTETSFENYGEPADTIPIIVDSKPISSSLCLNRFQTYSLKSHSDVVTERFSVHDNLLINVAGNVVTILPKTIQTAPSVDGLTNNWYKDHPEDNFEYWKSKEGNINNYLRRIYTMIPQLKGTAPRPKFDFDFLTQVFRTRTEKNIEPGFEEAALRYPQEDAAFRGIFNVFKKVSFIYAPDTLISEVTDYWKNSASILPFATYMKSIPESNRELAYNTAINYFRVTAGNNFIPYKVGSAFKMLRTKEFSLRNGIRIDTTIDEAKKFFQDQHDFLKHNLNTNQDIQAAKNTIEMLEIIILVLNIPLKLNKVIHIVSLDDFSSAITKLNAEFNRITQMLSQSPRYIKYQCLENDELNERADFFMKKTLAYTSKMNPSQKYSDFLTSLTMRYITIPETPEDIKFETDDLGEVKPFKTDEFVYLNNLEGGVKRLTVTEYNLLEMKSILTTVYKAVLKYIKTIAKSDFADKLTHEEINIILGKRKITKELKHYEIHIGKYQSFIKTIVDTNITGDNLTLALTRFGEDFEIISKVKADPVKVDDLTTFMLGVLEMRFPDSLYNDYNVIPVKTQKVLNSMYIQLPEDSDEDLFELNIPHIEMMFKYYANCLKRGYFVPNKTHTPEVMSIKKNLVPLLWKYRNGVSDTNHIPVTALKLVFPRNVRHKIDSIYGQTEWNDIIFEYQMPDDEVRHGNEVGIARINLANIISGLEDRNAILDNCNQTVASMGYEYSFNTIEMAKNLNVISEDNAKKLLLRLLPPVDDANDYINSFNRKYMLNELILRRNLSEKSQEEDKKKKRERSKDTKYIMNTYPRSSQFTIVDSTIEYNFDYVFGGVEFGEKDVIMSYNFKNARIIDEGVDLSKRNITIGSLRSTLFEPKLILDTEGNTAIFVASNGSKFIAYYGNTLKELIGEKGVKKIDTQGFIVTQRIADRKMTTYLYTYTYKNFGKTIESPTYITSIVYNKETNQVTFTERVEEERYDPSTKTHVKKASDKIKEVNILILLNGYTSIDELDSKKYSEATVTSSKIINKNNFTAVGSNYRVGGYFGSTVEIFDETGTMINSWNFQYFDLKTFDLNDNNITLVGITSAAKGYSVRIGTMKIGRTQSKVSPLFITAFDSEIKIGNAIIENVEKFTCNVSNSPNGTTYVTYKGKDLSYLTIINGSKVYETKFITDITSVVPSKESGYVAIYFGETNKTEVWICTGTLYETFEGECNWM